MNIEVPPLYSSSKYHPLLFGTLFVIGFLATSAVIFFGNSYFSCTVHKRLSQIVLALWGVGPPLWFFFEYFYYFPKHGNPTAGFSSLKDAQEVTSKLWAATAALLTVFYFISFPDKP